MPYTRTTEFRWLSGQERLDHSTVAVEYPRTEGDPYYPIPRDDTRELYRRYEARGADLADVTFVGRLARYQYLNMDQVVGQALSTADKLIDQLDLPDLPSHPAQAGAFKHRAGRADAPRMANRHGVGSIASLKFAPVWVTLALSLAILGGQNADASACSPDCAQPEHSPPLFANSSGTRRSQSGLRSARDPTPT